MNEAEISLAFLIRNYPGNLGVKSLCARKIMATRNLRILGKPKPPQTGKFSSKAVKEPVAQPNPKPAKKS